MECIRIDKGGERAVIFRTRKEWVIFRDFKQMSFMNDLLCKFTRAISGVARVPRALGQNIFLRFHQQNYIV